MHVLWCVPQWHLLDLIELAIHVDGLNTATERFVSNYTSPRFSCSHFGQLRRAVCLIHELFRFSLLFENDYENF